MTEKEQAERDAFLQALYVWREARSITGPEFAAVLALYDKRGASAQAAAAQGDAS